MVRVLFEWEEIVKKQELKQAAENQHLKMEKRIAWLMPEQIGPAAKLYERMNQICQSQEPAKPDASNGGGVIYGKMPQKPQTSPEQLRIEMEQQMEAKKALLQQVIN